MAKEKILIIEDDENIRMALEDDLSFEKYRVTAVESGEEGLRILKKDSFDLILLDLILPGIDGFEVCRRLKTNGVFVPIIMLTAKNDEVDKIVGLEIGADDYITKPFSTRELQARIRVILRRSIHKKESDFYFKIFNFGNVSVDFEKFEVKKKDKIVHLTAFEFSILKLFIQYKNKVLKRDFILDEIWGKEVYITNRTIDTHISHLRKKLDDDPDKPSFFQSVHRIGYRFVIENQK